MKKCGLRRAFTFGGTPMDPAKKLAQMDEEDRLLRQFNITDQFRGDRQAGLQARADSISGNRGLSSRQKSSALGKLSEQAGTFGTSISFDTPTGLSARQQMHLDLDTQDAQDRSALFDMNRQQQIASTFGYQQGKSNDPGQDLLAKSAAIRAEMEAKYGGNVAAAGKPATPPPPPKTGGTPPSDADIVKQELGNRPGYFRRTFAHGGTPAGEPFVDERGVIHGPEGTEKNPDKVKAKVKETGEPIMVGNKERIVNPEQAAAFDRHFASLGMTTDEFLEEATGEPVGPTLQRGLRHAANGGSLEGIPEFLRPRPSYTMHPPEPPQASFNIKPNNIASVPPHGPGVALENLKADPKIMASGRAVAQEAFDLADSSGAVDKRILQHRAAGVIDPSDGYRPANPTGPTRMTNDQMRASLRGQAGEAYRASLAPKPAAPAAAPTVPPAVMEHHTLPGRAAAPGAAPMMEPLSIPNKSAQPQGIVEKAKGIGKQVADAARSMTGGGGGTAPQATRPGMGVPGEGLLKGYGATQPMFGSTGLGGVKDAVKHGAKAIGPGLKGAGWLAALASAANQGSNTGGDLYELWNNDNADALTKVAGTLEGAGNVAGNVLSLGLLSNPVTSLVGSFTGNDTALTRGLKGTGRELDVDVLNKTAKADAEKAAATAAADAAKAKAAEAAKAKAAEVAASPLRDPTTNKLADEANANVRSLRSAGVRGDLTGDVTVDGKTGARGIRTIQTMNGNVYAGRDKNGQLQVVSGLDRSPEDNEAMRAKEAARMTADLTRQTRAFNDMSIASDLKSNSREDNRRGLMALAQRQMQEDSHNKGLDRALTQRGQDITLRGHELEYGAKAATLQNQMLQQNVERNAKTLDALLGGETIKVDGKDVANDKRQKVMTALTLTLGEAGRHLGHLTPKDLQEFMVAYDAAKDAEPGAASKIYRKWVEGRPWVEDYNPHRTVARAAGPEGQTGSLGMYQNPNGASVWQPAVVGQQFLTGEYSGPRQRLINQ